MIKKTPKQQIKNIRHSNTKIIKNTTSVLLYLCLLLILLLIAATQNKKLMRNNNCNRGISVIHVQKYPLCRYIIKRNMYHVAKESLKKVTGMAPTTVLPKRGFFTTHHEPIPFVKKNQSTKTTTENNQNTKKLETATTENNKNNENKKDLEIGIKEKQPHSGHKPHPQIILDIIKLHPKLFARGVIRLSLTHKVPDEDFCKKYNLPNIIEKRYAGKDRFFRDHWIVAWDAEIPLDTLIKIKENEGITHSLKEFIPNIPMIYDIYIKSHMYRHNKNLPNMTKEEIEQNLVITELLVQSYKTNWPNYALSTYAQNNQIKSTNNNEIKSTNNNEST